MYLKAVELQGFKSFPEKTRIAFEKDVTAVVGPNGSGKSNIADAILWVLGEQSTKTLRGGKMEDVIFGGTESRGAMGFAQVSLILDNTKRILEADGDEVMITRRCYRGGESEYCVNKEPLRLKDINDLFMDTGLGRAGYSIIGQGKISDIIAAKGEDRREVFEEAAGISRYRYRKDESERKLKRTDEELLRINDKTEELAMQLEPLKEQAEVAKKYLLLRDEKKELEISLWMENYDKLRARAEILSAEFASGEIKQNEARDALDRAYADTENISAAMREKDMEIETLRMTLGASEAETARYAGYIAVLKTNIGNNNENSERLKKEIADYRDKISDLDSAIAEKLERISVIDADIARIEEQLNEGKDRSKENAGVSNETTEKINLLSKRESEDEKLQAQYKTVLSMLAESLPELEALKKAAGEETEKANERLVLLEDRMSETRIEFEKEKTAAGEAEKILIKHRSAQSERENEIRKLFERCADLNVEIKSTASRILMLEEMEREYEGFGRAVKTVMREAGKGVLKGIHGPAASLIKTDDRFAVAIETALGASAQDIITDSVKDGKEAIELLKRDNGGRATFLPLDTIRGADTDIKRLPKGEKGFLGPATELVSCNARYSEIIRYLLGRTMVVETLADAVLISAKYDNRLRLVSLDGQIINAGGSMTGGSVAKGTGILSRAGELKSLNKRRAELTAEFEAKERELREAEENAAKAEKDQRTAEESFDAVRESVRKAQSEVEQTGLLLTAAREEIQNKENEKRAVSAKILENAVKTEETTRLSEEIQKSIEMTRREIEELTRSGNELRSAAGMIETELSLLRTDIASLEAERGAIANQAEQLAQIRGSTAKDEETRVESALETESKNKEIKEELRVKENRITELTAETETLKAAVSETNNLKLELEGRRTLQEKETRNKNNELLNAERICAGLKQKMVETELEEKQITDRLWDNYELSRTSAQARRRPIENMQKANRRLADINREMSILGNPNLGAIDEYERVGARFNYLTDQRDDIEKAKRELLDIIKDITGRMQEIFLREFTAVNESFGKTFAELFGGGRAALILEDEDNVLDCGIEIKVQPPGKTLGKMSLLSGGETALAAIALYFAILKVRPAPFCVMDEIETALDESNVAKFAAYLRKISDNTQIVIITHRRGTMEEADMLYGVTMQEKGVSKVIDLDLEEAEKSSA